MLSRGQWTYHTPLFRLLYWLCLLCSGSLVGAGGIWQTTPWWSTRAAMLRGCECWATCWWRVRVSTRIRLRAASERSCGMSQADWLSRFSVRRCHFVNFWIRQYSSQAFLTFWISLHLSTYDRQATPFRRMLRYSFRITIYPSINIVLLSSSYYN